MSNWLGVLVVLLTAATPGEPPQESVLIMTAPTEAVCLRLLAEETHRALDNGAKHVSGGCADVSNGGAG